MTKFCDYTDIDTLNSKGEPIARLVAENACLRDKVGELNEDLAEHDAALQNLGNDVSNLKGVIDSFLTGQDAKWQSYEAKYTDAFEHSVSVIESTSSLYSNLSMFLTGIIALSVVVSLGLVTRHKKSERKDELNEIVTEAEKEIKDKTSGFVRKIVINSLNEPVVTKQFDQIKESIYSDCIVHINTAINELDQLDPTVDDFEDGIAGGYNGK